MRIDKNNGRKRLGASNGAKHVKLYRNPGSIANFYTSSATGLHVALKSRPMRSVRDPPTHDRLDRSAGTTRDFPRRAGTYVSRPILRRNNLNSRPPRIRSQVRTAQTKRERFNTGLARVRRPDMSVFIRHDRMELCTIKNNSTQPKGRNVSNSCICR